MFEKQQQSPALIVYFVAKKELDFWLAGISGPLEQTSLYFIEGLSDSKSPTHIIREAMVESSQCLKNLADTTGISPSAEKVPEKFRVWNR